MLKGGELDPFHLGPLRIDAFGFLTSVERTVALARQRLLELDAALKSGEYGKYVSVDREITSFPYHSETSDAEWPAWYAEFAEPLELEQPKLGRRRVPPRGS
jgi:hypothetical protein